MRLKKYRPETLAQAARIPGVCTLLTEKEANATTTDFTNKLKDLISEDISVVTESEDIPEYISSVLGGLVEPQDIVFENETKTVIIRTDGSDIRLFNRLRLLEQLMPYKIGG